MNHNSKTLSRLQCAFPLLSPKKNMKGLVQKKKGYTFTGVFLTRELLLAMVTFGFLPIPKGRKLWGHRLRPLHRAVLMVPCSSHVQTDRVCQASHASFIFTVPLSLSPGSQGGLECSRRRVTTGRGLQMVDFHLC